MAFQRVNSNSISIFPSSMRTGFDVYSRFTTELNLVNMITRITDIDSYVINYDSSSSDGTLEFNLGGYYFRTTRVALQEALNLSQGRLSADTTIYAVALVSWASTETPLDAKLIGYTDQGSTNSLDEVDSGSSSHFLGLNLTTSQADLTTLGQWVQSQTNENITMYSLPVIAYSTATGTWGIPEGSTNKLSIDSFEIPIITNEQIDAAFL